jgi:methionyl aminopeptidase
MQRLIHNTVATTRRRQILKRCYSTTTIQHSVITKPGIVVSPRRQVPEHVMKPKYAQTGRSKFFSKTQIHTTEEEVQSMRKSCALARRTLNYAKTLVQEGVTTEAIDQKVHEFIVSHNAYPSPLGYGNKPNLYPKSICTSVNNVMVHGIPDDRPLQNGDIINIDVTVYLNGYHGDCSETFFVGDNHSEQTKTLVTVTKQAVYNAIKICGPGVPVHHIGCSVDDTIEPYGFVSARDFCGHGVGKQFHSNPQVMFYREHVVKPEIMQSGMTFTIEPIINVSTIKWKLWKDAWTIVTSNGEMSATWEHTLMITPNGVEILTADDNEQRFFETSVTTKPDVTEKQIKS